MRQSDTVNELESKASLISLVERVAVAGLLGAKRVQDAAVEFNAMLEGLANAELRGATLRVLPEGAEGQAWHAALTTVILGWGRGAP